MKIIFFTMIFLLSTAQSIAQLNHIDSLIITPRVPTNFDEIKLVAFTKFPSSPFKLVSSQIVISDSKVLVNSIYSAGGNAFPVKSQDTINIGKLKFGTYKLVFNMQINNLDRFRYDIDSIYFNVNDLLKTEPVQSIFTIHPNPVSNVLIIRSNSSNNKMPYVITDCVGRELIKGELDTNLNYIDTGLLPKGLFLLNIGNLKTEVFKIVKH